MTGTGIGRWLAFGCATLAAVAASAATPQPTACQKIVLAGEVTAGQEWKAEIAQGWVFRVIPIQPAAAGYSGWDLVVDRDHPAGFPDALLVATPPFNSINEREVGTTFGLRAQDVLGWNPRSFRFLTDPAAFHRAQELYLAMSRSGQLRPGADSSRNSTASPSSGQSRATGQLMEIEKDSAAGQFRILDARLTPGVSDAAPYVETWALQSARTPQKYESVPGAPSTPLGQLRWIRFSITLWLPAPWKAPPALHSVRSACAE